MSNLPTALQTIQAKKWLTAKRYSKEHETISYDDKTGIGIVTITDHAQSTLGDVVFVELPAEGKEVKQGGMFLWQSRSCPPPKRLTEAVGAVESVKAASDIVSRVLIRQPYFDWLGKLSIRPFLELLSKWIATLQSSRESLTNLLNRMVKLSYLLAEANTNVIFRMALQDQIVGSFGGWGIAHKGSLWRIYQR